MNPLVTIVIPAYNHANYLKESINSVLNQTYPDIELIVLDDGSTDATQEVLKGFGDQFFWETHRNMGQAKTLNKGWSIARGSILSYLSADDILYPLAVERCVEELKARPEIVLCYPDFHLIDSGSRVIRLVSAPEYSYEDMALNFICAPGVGAFFRKYCFEEAGGWDPSLSYHPDYEYWLRLGLQGPFFHLPECLGGFRLHEGSQTFSTVSVFRGDEPLRIMKAFLARVDLPDSVAKHPKIALFNASMMSAQTHFRSGHYRQGIIRIYEAIQYSFWPLLSSLKPYKQISNGMLNKVIHRLLWKFKKIDGRKSNSKEVSD